MANPTLLTQPFAANGDKNIIPNTTAIQGAFSQDKGFPAECSLPLGAGGVAPSRQDMNGAFNMLSTLMYYAQKGYTWHWDAGQEYFAGCVVIDDTDGKMYQCIQDVAAGGSVPSADSTNWKKFSTGGGGKSVGEIVLRAWGEANVGELMCNGAEISRAMYPDYAQWSAEHNYPWGAGDGVTTVNLPNLIGRFPEGATTAGGYHELGLPNIDGKFTSSECASYEQVNTVPFKKVEPSANSGINRNSSSGTTYTVEMDLSTANPIYGNSNTVQPPSALLIPYVVVFTEATPDSALVDMTQVANDLAGKANRDLSNLTDTANEKLKAMAFPSDTIITVPLSGATTTYTAPANGYVSVGCNGGTVEISKGSNLFINAPAASIGSYFFAPVRKGDTVTLTATGSPRGAFFFYAEGEV